MDDPSAAPMEVEEGATAKEEKVMSIFYIYINSASLLLHMFCRIRGEIV
jgi:hypothetical protein